MKVFINQTRLSIVNPTREQLDALEAVTSSAVVSVVNDVASITANPATLYKVLCDLSKEYDIDLI